MFGTWGSVVLSGAALILAVWAGLRSVRVALRTRERRLGYLSAFFFLFALVQGALMVETVLIVSGPPVRPLEEAEGFQLLFWVRHAVFIVALGAAVSALGGWRPGKDRPQDRDGPGGPKGPDHPKRPGGKAGFVVPFFQLAHPFLLVLEGVGLFYLVFRAADHHARRDDPGSLRLAFGFALLLVGHLSPFLVEPDGPPAFGIPGGGSALFVFAGTVLLLLSTWGQR